MSSDFGNLGRELSTNDVNQITVWLLEPRTNCEELPECQEITGCSKEVRLNWVTARGADGGRRREQRIAERAE